MDDTNATLRDKHLMIAIDRTEDSKRAVLYVADFLGGFNGFRVTLLSVIQEPEADFFESEQEKNEWIKSREKEMNQMLENYRQVLIQSGFSEDKVDIKLRVGDAKTLSDMILSMQCQLSCCTVVVGRHHKSKTEEFLLGSVSSQVVHEAKNCAVWVVE